jgi:hypothetical protein
MRRTLTARQTIARPYKIWLLVLVCTIAIAATDDSWAMALGCPINSELSIVTVDDDDLDDHPVDITIRRSCMRQPTDCLESVDLKDVTVYGAYREARPPIDGMDKDSHHVLAPAP